MGQAIEDNAYLGIHEMTMVGRGLAKALYGNAPRYSYFVGGSTGGRQGLMEAQRYPNDYDGIISACPAINWHQFLPSDLWPQVVMVAAKNFVPKSKLDAATTAAVAACDALDGVTDGVIDDPSRCTYDPKALVGTQVGDSTFTETDADVVRRIWEGPRAQDGGFLWYGLARGTDLSALAGTGGSPLTGKPFGIPLDWFRFFLVQNPQWDWTTLTPAGFELLWRQSVEEFGAVIGTDDPDLTRFRDRGGKIIILHGLADQLIPAEGNRARPPRGRVARQNRRSVFAVSRRGEFVKTSALRFVQYDRVLQCLQCGVLSILPSVVAVFAVPQCAFS